jgi:hypothetical protein
MGGNGDCMQALARLGVRTIRANILTIWLILFTCLTVWALWQIHEQSQRTRHLAMIARDIAVKQEADIDRGQATLKLICQVSNDNRETIRSILLDAQLRVATSKQRSAHEKQDAIQFYDQLLARIPPDPCENG